MQQRRARVYLRLHAENCIIFSLVWESEYNFEKKWYSYGTNKGLSRIYILNEKKSDMQFKKSKE